MGKYRRLTLKERYQIEILVGSGLGVRKIAEKLNRAPSTISHELRRLNRFYQSEEAQKLCEQRRSSWQSAFRKIHGEIEDWVRKGLTELNLSPQQIALRLNLERKKSFVSHQTIYRFIERDTDTGGELKKELRLLRKKRKDRKRSSWHPERVKLPPRKMIDERPKVVERRTRLGDYERDLVLGKVNGSALITIVDRKSRFLKLGFMQKKNAQEVHQLTVKLLNDQKVHTITNDNGGEFARHPQTARALKAKIYFSRSYRAWERGTNENLNGLLRQYFPRKTEIGQVSPEELQRIEDLLNHRPRKCLGYRTPFEVHHGLKSQLFR